jgi:hypothetical protein
MTRPPKRTGDDVLQRIAIALDTMADDPNAPRTKREVERRTGLSHDAVARAFRQDAEHATRWDLTTRFNALGARPARRTGPHIQELKDLQDRLKAQNKRIAELEAALDRHAMTVLALHLELAQLPDPGGNVVTLGRNRQHRDRTL